VCSANLHNVLVLLYEKLGGVVRSSRTAAQRQAPKKATATRAAKKAA
jgi:hypothetical protein